MQSIVYVHVVSPEGNVNLHATFNFFADIGYADVNWLCMVASDFGRGTTTHRRNLGSVWQCFTLLVKPFFLASAPRIVPPVELKRFW